MVALIDEAVCPHVALPALRHMRWQRSADCAEGGFVPAMALHGAPGMPAHGTRMAGLIAADGVMAGVAPAVARLDNYVLHPAAEPGIEAQIIAALLDIARRGEARLINLSWGSSPDPAYATPFREAVAAVATAGQLLVVAAGNQAVDLDLQPHWPVCVDDPALLSVTWIDADHRLRDAGYGQRSVQFAVPLDGHLLSTAPAGAAAPGPRWPLRSVDPALAHASAWCKPCTSVATALVSRQVLRMWQMLGKDAGAAQVTQRLRQAALAPQDPLTRQRLRHGWLQLA